MKPSETDKTLLVNGEPKFTARGFSHLLKRIGGLIELRDYDVSHNDVADLELSRHLENYFDYLDGLKRCENAIYEFLERNKGESHG